MNRVIDHDPAADATKMTVRRLSPVMGAEIVGLDLAQPLSDAQRAQVEHAFNEHKVLCSGPGPFDGRVSRLLQVVGPSYRASDAGTAA